MNPLLTDEEIEAIAEDEDNFTANDVFRAIAKAQAKQIVGWLRERLFRINYNDPEDDKYWGLAREDLNELLKAVGIKED